MGIDGLIQALDQAVLSMVGQVRSEEMSDCVVIGEQLGPDLARSAILTHEQARIDPGLPDWVIANQPPGAVIVLLNKGSRVYVHYLYAN